MNILIFLLLSTLLIIGVEVLKRIFSVEPANTRRIVHVGAAILAAISPLFIGKWIFIVACIGFALLLLGGRKTTFFSAIHEVKRRTYGDIFLPLGEAFSALVVLPGGIREFQFGILVMGISDAVAGLVGEHFGRHKVTMFGNTKSVEGSLGFFITTLLLTFIFSPGLGIYLLIIPLTLTLVEFVSWYGSDNMTLPIAGAFLIRYLA